jgi:hypothetical protein
MIELKCTYICYNSRISIRTSIWFPAERGTITLSWWMLLMMKMPKFYGTSFPNPVRNSSIQLMQDLGDGTKPKSFKELDSKLAAEKNMGKVV